MAAVSVFISLLFIVTTAITALFLLRAIRGNWIISLTILVWLIVQSLLASGGFYLNDHGIPPRILLSILVPILAVVLAFIVPNLQLKLLQANLGMLTLLHVVRIPVEISLFYLAAAKLVPEMMTFRGANFDILSGLTAPFIWWLCFKTPGNKRKLLIAWNVVCLVLVFNVLIRGLLSAPTAFQKLSFDQSNTAVFYFPFIWLPAFVVPSVLFSHFLVLWRLLIRKENLPANDLAKPSNR